MRPLALNKATAICRQFFSALCERERRHAWLDPLASTCVIELMALFHNSSPFLISAKTLSTRAFRIRFIKNVVLGPADIAAVWRRRQSMAAARRQLLDPATRKIFTNAFGRAADSRRLK
jgi:hypothetical protein